MDGHTKMPAISFGPDTSYDTLHSVITDWCVRVWLTEGIILVARWIGDACIEEDAALLMVWSNAEEDYITPVTVLTDHITRIEVL
jgi:hypothetical protein